MECGNKREGLKFLNRLRHRYGPASFAVVGGHGTPKGVLLGSDELTIKDFLREGGGTLSLAFTEDAPIIFNSCSTGVEGGIAELTSMVVGTTTEGPTGEGCLLSIKVEFNKRGKIVNLIPYYVDRELKEIESRRYGDVVPVI